MHIISLKKIQEFWRDSKNANAEGPLRAWYQVVRQARWQSPADVRKTYRTADIVDSKIVFNIGGNKYRLVAVIDYEGHKVFVRAVLTHVEYDTGNWKKDTFGENWKKRKPRQTGSDGNRPFRPQGKRRKRRK